MQSLQSAFGIVALIAIAWAVGENRRAVKWKQVGIGLAVTLVTAVVLIKIPQVVSAFSVVNDAVGAIAAGGNLESKLRRHVGPTSWFSAGPTRPP